MYSTLFWKASRKRSASCRASGEEPGLYSTRTASATCPSIVLYVGYFEALGKGVLIFF